MSTWHIALYTTIICLIVIAIIEFISRWRKYSSHVTASLFRYAQLAKSCPTEQLVLVFQEVAEYESMTALTHFQHVKLHSILTYLEGRLDQANIKDVIIVGAG